jgi:ribonuclease PH
MIFSILLQHHISSIDVAVNNTKVLCNAIDVAVNNTKVLCNATEMQQWDPLALLSVYTIFRTAVNNDEY